MFAVLMLLTAITYRDTITRERIAVENAVAIARVSATLIESFIQDVEGTTLAIVPLFTSVPDAVRQMSQTP